MNRRTFVKLVGASAPAFALPHQLLANSNDTIKPIVISTWEPNKKANARAWEILSAHGSALDAVHQGVMVPEADPDDHSVGLGGNPDRDGHVTCDACIMDHMANIGSVMCLEHIVHAISVARLDNSLLFRRLLKACGSKVLVKFLSISEVGLIF